MKIKFYNQHRISLSLSNIQFKKGCTIDLYDIAEDAESSKQLMNEINAITLYEKFEINRETDTYIRLVSVDKLGNRHYLEIEKGW